MLNHEHICSTTILLFLGLGACSCHLPPFITYMILQFELLCYCPWVWEHAPCYFVTYMILQFELRTLSSMYAHMAKSTLDTAQSDLEDFTDAQDSQDCLSTLTKSENKVRELQSLLIAKSKQGKDQVAELQTALDREKRRVKDLMQKGTLKD